MEIEVIRKQFEIDYPQTQAAVPLDRLASDPDQYVFQVANIAWGLYQSAWNAALAHAAQAGLPQ